MAVESRISSKTYKTNVDELEPNDQGLKSDLYEVSIFNHVIKISPGLAIKEDNLSYCYVYAIKNNKVVAKIGVYETLDETEDIFDLSTFSEGTLCLFDVYERNPSLILELEETSQKNEERDTVFDYMLTKINDDEPDKKTTLTKNSYKGILLVLTAKKKVLEDENSRIITNLLNIIKKSVSTKKYFNETTQEAIKKYAKDLNKKVLSLIVSEPFLKVRFIFTKDDEAYDDSEFREWSIKTDITEYVIVSVDTFEVIETYPVDSLNEKYADMLVDNMPKGTSLNKQPEKKKIVEPPLEPTLETIAEDKSVSFKPKTKDPYEVDLNAEESNEPEETKPKDSEPKEPEPKSRTKTKAETKSESKPKSKTKVETKAESKSETKAESKSESKAETKPKSRTKTKPESKPVEETKTEGYDLDLNAIDEPEQTKTSKPESKKLKAPGSSIRSKIKKSP
jgi:hypothetical protein